MFWPFIGAGQTITIPEFMASNSTVLVDEDGDFSDWIELHNAEPLAVYQHFVCPPER
ncbi:MAG: hypothetical protein JW801_03485 [Bacteroidales bacterium]|nr:hypothetical protein [Bacteroidales bacterium]